jgi:hypothetical protein
VQRLGGHTVAVHGQRATRCSQGDAPSIGRRRPRPQQDLRLFQQDPETEFVLYARGTCPLALWNEPRCRPIQKSRVIFEQWLGSSSHARLLSCGMRQPDWRLPWLGTSTNNHRGFCSQDLCAQGIVRFLRAEKCRTTRATGDRVGHMPDAPPARPDEASRFPQTCHGATQAPALPAAPPIIAVALSSP